LVNKKRGIFCEKNWYSAQNYTLKSCFKSCHEASKTQRNIKKLGENLVSWRLCGKGSGLLKQFLKE
jgi:hypothetical protein